MAITLPYPNMDFTALDVLHAADLDKMVANTEYLAQQLQAVQIPLSSFCTASSGFTISQYSYVYKIGNIVFGNIAIKKDSGTFSSTQDSTAAISNAYKPLLAFNSYGTVSASEWSSEFPCYVYLFNSIIIKDTQNKGCNWAKVSFMYVTN